MGMVVGNRAKIIFKAPGNLIDLKALEKYIQVHLIMKEILKMGINMVEEYKYSKMAIDMKDCMPMESLKAMAFMLGKMAHFIKVSLKMG